MSTTTTKEHSAGLLAQKVNKELSELYVTFQLKQSTSNATSAAEEAEVIAGYPHNIPRIYNNWKDPEKSDKTLSIIPDAAISAEIKLILVALLSSGKDLEKAQKLLKRKITTELDPNEVAGK